jgi:hypothetical protein
MKGCTMLASAAGAAAWGLAIATWAAPAHAQVTTTTPASAPVVEQVSYKPPNRWIILGGAIAFVGSYVPSIIVAAANNNPHDNKLYIPIVGPWLDLSERPPCGGVGQLSCVTANGYAALLIVDGVFQAVGAGAIVVGLLVPERRTHKVIAKAEPDLRPEVHVLPAHVGPGAYGVAAFGRF